MHHSHHSRNRHGRTHLSKKQKTIRGLIALAAVLAAVFAAVGLFDHIQQKKRQEAAANAAELEETAKSKRISELDDPKWSDENTLCIDDMLYGFDHRIETYLFIGTDHTGTAYAETDREQIYHGSMADFLLLMVIDHTDGKYGFLQIDRNTVTEVPMLDDSGDLAGYPVEQICVAHWYGTNPEESAENTVTTVSELIGDLDHIDGYYVLNMDEIGTLNSSVGGVEVTFDKDLTEADPAFQKGATVRLSDAQAETLVRIRMAMKDDSNESRMERQRLYMNGFFKKAISEVKAHPNFANNLWNTLKDVAVTDMSGNAFSRIAETLRSDESRGILKFEGKTQIGSELLADGEKHEEFYPETESMTEVLTELFSLQPLEEDALE